MKLDRRRFLGSSVGVAAAAGVTAEWVWPKHTVSYRRPRSAVAVLNAAEYSERIEALLLDGLRLFRLQVLGRSILLKPNLVEDLPGSCEHELDSDWRRGAMFPPSWRGAGCDW